MNKWHGGKGSARRPKKVSDERLQENWDRVFKKKEKQGEEK